MFMGEYKHSIDPKGRLIMPAKFREELGTSFVITRGLDHCLLVYRKEEWEQFAAKLQQLPMNKQSNRKMQRFFMGAAVECEADKQGRIRIPEGLAIYAELGKDVVLEGVTSRIEIWNRERWEAANSFDDMEDAAEDMDDFVI